MDEDDGVADLKVGDQFWAVNTSRTPYEVTAIRHSPGAQNHLWAVITARQLIYAGKPFDQMPLVLVSKHDYEISVHRRIK